MMKTIELDCAPGYPRPGDLIEGVVEGTVLAGQLADTTTRFFGNWTWEFPDVSDEEWREAQKVTKPRIEKLYHSGVVRYASW